MTDTVSTALDQVNSLYSDTRVEYCYLRLGDGQGGVYRLDGEVLDQATLDHVDRELHKRLPGLHIDLSAVRVLGKGTRTVTVGTNLTGLYARPSFLAEQLSQLLNGWPLEILKEEGGWCFVRQTDGYLGWVYATYLAEALTCTFTHLVCTPEAQVVLEPRIDAAISTRILGGTAVVVDASEGDWCHLALSGDRSGWVRTAALRGFDVLPETAEARRVQMVEDAARYVGAQYLWGGCSAWGIDCSGFAQLIHRLSGITLPRDADMQYAAGRAVEFPFEPGDLLFYADPLGTGRIDHVTISLGGWDIIHSSRRINGVYFDNVEAVEVLRDSFVGARTFVG